MEYIKRFNEELADALADGAKVVKPRKARVAKPPKYTTFDPEVLYTNNSYEEHLKALADIKLIFVDITENNSIHCRIVWETSKRLKIEILPKEAGERTRKVTMEQFSYIHENLSEICNDINVAIKRTLDAYPIFKYSISTNIKKTTISLVLNIKHNTYRAPKIRRRLRGY